jgi:hypothetical protein
MTGFTHEEIARYYDRQITEVAESQKMTKVALLEKMKQYYNGFCFDGKTFVYNPFSTVLFFDFKEFDNFWFNSGTPEQLVSFLRQIRLNDEESKRFDMEEFRGLSIRRDRITTPRSDRFHEPETYLYQLGYLSLRPGTTEQDFVLDYPNAEVRQSMGLRLLESYYKSPRAAEGAIQHVLNALSQRDPVALVIEINILLSSLPYDDLKDGKLSEGQYRRDIFTLFYGAGLDPRAESHNIVGRSDVVLKYGGQAWVIELKTSKAGIKDVDLAHDALTQILERNYGGPYRNPVSLGAVINEKTRIIKAWECKGGLASKPEPEAKAEEIAEKKTQEKAEMKTQEKVEEDEDEGWKPRF